MRLHEMHVLVRQIAKELDNSREASFLEEQVDVALNSAQDSFVGEQIESIKKGIGITDAQLNVQPLLRRNEKLELSVGEKGSKWYNYTVHLPKISYRDWLNFNVDELCGDEMRRGAVRVYPSLDETILRHPFHKPLDGSPVAELGRDSFQLYTRGMAKKVSMDYVVFPRPMALKNARLQMLVAGEEKLVDVKAAECELPERTHRELCKRAAAILMRSIKDPNWQFENPRDAQGV